MTHRGIRKIYRRILFSIGLVLTFSYAAGWVPPMQAVANNARAVQVHVDGDTHSVATDAINVAEVLHRLDIELGEFDVVEPGLEEIITGAVFNINVYRSRPVIVVDGGREFLANSPHQSPKLIAESAGLTVYEEDTYEVEWIDDFASSPIFGQKIHIDRATPVNVHVDNLDLVLRSHLGTVGELLEEKGIGLGKSDIVVPALDTTLTQDMDVSITRVNSEVLVVEEDADYVTEFTTDSSLPSGLIEIVEEGHVGTQLATYHIVMHDGVEVERKFVSAKIIKAPKNRKALKGTGHVNNQQYVDLALSMAAKRGWTGEESAALYRMWVREANFNPYATNLSSGACGIPQSLPCSKMSSHGADYRTNAATQIAWGLDYIQNRYGSPLGAWRFWQVNHWY